MIKVMGLALYGPLAASTRYRLGQYVPGLASQGINLEICSLLDDDYLRRRFSGASPSITALCSMYLKRFADLRHMHEYDLAMLQCELFPLFPGWLERSLIRLPFIYDFDDAFYLKYCSNRFRWTSPVLANKFDRVIAGASAVTAGNHVLDQYAQQFNTNTNYLPTVVDTTRYVPKCVSRNDIFTVGWIGSPSTSTYLTELIEPLSVLGQEGAVRFVVIGGKAPAIHGVNVVEVAWAELTEIDLINTFDVGVMPLPDDDWARGKCAFKLIQYMACGVPVIASPVGANIDVVNGECGFLAATSNEWVDALRLLRDHPGKRTDMGDAGRERVVKNYSLEHNLPVLANVIRKVAGKN
ncbi:MAG: glycosyltransferase family 4 protein [Gallionella sp.]|nr:glycosyltransferase family 4 protein [Gallionella sp.]